MKDEILSAIDLWDNIVGWEQELMGIGNVRPNLVNNHIFAISPEGSYMWASDYRIAFVYTYLNNILLYDNVMRAKDNAWGPAHEIGHIHQLAIDWPSSTESSNNLFSNYVLYKLGKYCSRGTELNLPKAKPFYYLEDRKQGDTGLDTTPPDVGYYTQFQNIRPITKDIRGRINGRQATITNGDEAVAFELRERNASGKLLYFSTFFSFEIPSSVSLANAKLYAVQADGNRIELAE